MSEAQARAPRPNSHRFSRALDPPRQTAVRPLINRTRKSTIAMTNST